MCLLLKCKFLAFASWHFNIGNVANSVMVFPLYEIAYMVNNYVLLAYYIHYVKLMHLSNVLHSIQLYILFYCPYMSALVMLIYMQSYWWTSLTFHWAIPDLLYGLLHVYWLLYNTSSGFWKALLSGQPIDCIYFSFKCLSTVYIGMSFECSLILFW